MNGYLNLDIAVERVKHQAGGNLGIKVGGLLGHFVRGIRNGLDGIGIHRFEQEG